MMGWRGAGRQPPRGRKFAVDEGRLAAAVRVRVSRRELRDVQHPSWIARNRKSQRRSRPEALKATLVSRPTYLQIDVERAVLAKTSAELSLSSVEGKKIINTILERGNRNRGM